MGEEVARPTPRAPSLRPACRTPSPRHRPRDPLARTVQVRTVQQLEGLAPVRAEDRATLQRVLDAFPVRVTEHLRALMQGSAAVAAQFLPDVREAEAIGQEVCFAGLLPTNAAGVERMYPDRCIIMPHPGCPAHCRYCFRKFYDHGREAVMSEADLDAAVAYVAAEPAIREVLITGGEPLLAPARLLRLMSGLRRVPHVGPLRVACRALVLAPQLVTDEVIAQLACHQDLRAGRPVELACHANHPDEISAATVDALARLREAGIHVYNQAVLLRGINCDADVLEALLWKLRGCGVESYYLFFAGPVLGMDHQRPRLDEALALKAALRRRGSGRANPQLIVTTRLGKVELGVDGWIVEREADGRHVWIRTPYTLDGLRQLSPGFALPGDARLDGAGHIVMRYLDGPPPA